MSKIDQWSKMAENASLIDNELYAKFDVKRGLRNADQTGVLVGLTNVGTVIGVEKTETGTTPVEGRLEYRGISIDKIVDGFQTDKREGFDETAYLLLYGKLPNRQELEEFTFYLAQQRYLPQYFTKDIILSFRGKDVMNMLARSVLALYTTEENPDDVSTKNVLEQSLSLIAKFPAIVAYSFHGMRYHHMNKALIIRHPKPEMSTAENFLYMLKGGNRYTPLEVETLDLMLVLHAEHGGGNNSSFTTHVVSSSLTDTYSAIAAALGSLKGPLHGGANIKVMAMVDEIKNNVRDWSSEKEVGAYLHKILDKKAFDGSGKIYGLGHAVYTLSDPRAILLKKKAREVAIEKNKLDEFELYSLIEKIAPAIFAENKKDNKVIAPNVDFYSGFVNCTLDIPPAIYTPLFAMSRIAGWSAHRIEEINSAKRIIRPAYKAVGPKTEYLPLSKR